jgi:hypothetical protein
VKLLLLSILFVNRNCLPEGNPNLSLIQVTDSKGQPAVVSGKTSDPKQRDFASRPPRSGDMGTAAPC